MWILNRHNTIKCFRLDQFMEIGNHKNFITIELFTRKSYLIFFDLNESIIIQFCL